MKAINVEVIIGHDIGISASYYGQTEKSSWNELQTMSKDLLKHKVLLIKSNRPLR
jgi:hypothetical protein